MDRKVKEGRLWQVPAPRYQPVCNARSDHEFGSVSQFGQRMSELVRLRTVTVSWNQPDRSVAWSEAVLRVPPPLGHDRGTVLFFGTAMCLRGHLRRVPGALLIRNFADHNSGGARECSARATQ